MSTYKELLELGDKELLENKDYREAEKYYNKAMKLQPIGIDAINALIVWRKLMKAEIDSTLLEKALKAIEKHPKHFLTLFNISLIYLEKQDYTNAHEFLTRAYKIQNSNQQLLYNLAFWKQELKDYSGAIELYDKIIDKDPTHQKAITHIAICLHYLGQTEEAAKRIRKWIDVGTPDAKLYVNMGILLKKMKKYDEALEYFNKSLSHAPNFHAMYNTATLYYEKHDLESAVKWFEKAKGTAKNSNEQKLWTVGLNAVTDKKGAAAKAESNKSLKEKFSEEEKEDVDDPPKVIKAESKQAIEIQGDISSEDGSDHQDNEENQKEEEEDDNGREDEENQQNDNENQESDHDNNQDEEYQNDEGNQREIELQKIEELKQIEELEKQKQFEILQKEEADRILNEEKEKKKREEEVLKLIISI